MNLEISCAITIPINSISVNSIELAALKGAKEAANKLFLEALEKIE